MLQWQRVHIFDELKHHGVEFDLFNPLLMDDIDEAQEKLIKMFDEGEYVLFMTCLCNNNHIRKTTVEEIKRKGVPTLSFRPDNLAIPFNDKEMATTFDLLWLTSKQTKYLYDKWGAKSVFVPYAANPYRYVYHKLPITRRVCFIGNPHGSRASIINSITSCQLPIDMYNGGKKNNEDNQDAIIPKWSIASAGTISVIRTRLKFHEGREMLRGALLEKIKGAETIIKNDNLNNYPGLTFEEMIEKYSEYVLSLSFSSYAKTDALKKSIPVVNLRNFEIPMCGGLQICRYSDEMADYFEDGKEAVLYRSDDEKIDKIRYYLNTAKESEIRTMKEAARKRCENEHSWSCRFSKVFQELGIRF